MSLKARRHPRISVILPVYNTERFLAECIASLRAQTCTDFEVLAVDDASTDGSWGLLKAVAAKDRRIRVFRHARNRGIAAALRTAKARLRGEFLARMDSDDVAHPRRLELQLRRFDSEPGLGLVGGAMMLWTPAGKKYSGSPEGHDAIRTAFVFQNAVAHPTVMCRLSALKGLRYRDGYYATEDYDLWTHMVLRTRFANLPEALIDYRVHPAQSGPSRAMDQYEAASRVRIQYLIALGFRFDAGQARTHNSVCPPFARPGDAGLPSIRDWLQELAAQNRRLGALPAGLLEAEIRSRFASACASLGLSGLAFFAARGGPLRSMDILKRPHFKAALKHHLRRTGS